MGRGGHPGGCWGVVLYDKREGEVVYECGKEERVEEKEKGEVVYEYGEEEKVEEKEIGITTL